MRSATLIFSQPRCGSTTLLRVLDCHPAIEAVHEPFNPKAATGGVRIEDAHALQKRLAALAPCNLVKHVWHPAGWPFPAGSPLNRRLLRDDWRRVLFLNRRNLLRQEVSNQMAIQTGVFMADDSRRPDTETFAYRALDEQKLAWFLEHAPRRRDRLRKLLVRHETPFVELWYEELFDQTMDMPERRAAVEKILAFMDLSLEDPGVDLQAVERLLSPHVSRFNTPETYDRIPGIRALAARYGSDRNGHLQ